MCYIREREYENRIIIFNIPNTRIGGMCLNPFAVGDDLESSQQS